MTDTLFPVHLYDGGELPKEGTFYVVAGNGCFLHKDTGIVSALVPVEGVAVLEDLKQDLWVRCNLPKVPADMVYQIKEFFALVVEKYRAESCTILYFNKETQEFRVEVTRQFVSHGGVAYRRQGTTHEDGFLPVGTIHSHCDFQAFHSGTDVHDEEYFDGLHCTFGHNDRNEFTVSASVVVNGQRTKVDPLTVLDGLDHVEKDFYKVNVTPDETKRAQIFTWFAKVNDGFKDLEKEPKKGDRITWDGEAKELKAKYGEGPFVIEEVSEITERATGKVKSHLYTFVTESGEKHQLNECFFKKVTS